MGPALWSLLPAAPSDMVAPGSVTSRLGSVFPFLLVLVDLQYEGKSCPALPRREERALGSVPTALPRHGSGASLRAAAGAARLGQARSPPLGGGRRLVPGSFGEEVPGPGGAGRELGVWSGAGPKGSEAAGRAGPGARGATSGASRGAGTRGREQPSGPASRGPSPGGWRQCGSTVLGEAAGGEPAFALESRGGGGSASRRGR